jgi:phosphoenolpyruvate-protein phosphotransferase (PTS system enzyme I)
MKKIHLREWSLIAGEAVLFLMVTTILWVDEFMDLPYWFSGDPSMPYKHQSYILHQEYILETTSILMVAAVVITITFLSLRRSRRLQNTISTKEQEISQLRAFARNTSITLQGRGVSPGMAEGVAMIYHPTEIDSVFERKAIGLNEVNSEINRLDRALEAAICSMDNTRKQYAGEIAPVEHALFDVHLAMLKDVEFWDKCRRRVREDLIRAEQAVAEEVRRLATILDGLKKETMREHSADIRDIGRMVLRSLKNLNGESPNQLMPLPPNTILVARELLPSDLLQLDHANLAALVMERNGPASHIAILARTRHIPALSDIKDAASLLMTGDRLLVDAEAGTLTMAPTRVQTACFVARKSKYAGIEPATEHSSDLKCATRDGTRIRLYANISRTDEAHLVLENRLDGVGLFRSEFLFLEAEQPPDFNTQSAIYSAVAKTIDPEPVVIRTMDIGGDKIPFFNRSGSILASGMGKRGLAFSLTEKTMFRTQIRAILKSAQDSNVRIMFPMVTGAADLQEALYLFDEVVEADRLARRPPIGAMIETPAAVFEIHDILQMVDFVSIGTNDLSSFILAMDRRSQNMPDTLSFLHPGVLRATEHVVSACLKQGKGLTVCGEAAGNPVTACLLVGMGVRDLSMNPFNAARVSRALRQLNLEQMEEAAREALNARTPEDVRKIIESVLHEAAVPDLSDPWTFSGKKNLNQADSM